MHSYSSIFAFVHYTGTKRVMVISNVPLDHLTTTPHFLFALYTKSINLHPYLAPHKIIRVLLNIVILTCGSGLHFRIS